MVRLMVARNWKIKYNCQLSEWYKEVWNIVTNDKLMCNIKIRKNLYINDILEYLNSPSLHPPKLHQRHISVLVYADDAVLLARTPIGLKRALKKFADFCKMKKLEINYQKTKIMTFDRRQK